MKKAIKTVMIIAGLLQGGAVMGEAPKKVTINTGNKHSPYSLKGNGCIGNLGINTSGTCDFIAGNEIVVDFTLNEAKKTCTLMMSNEGVTPTSAACPLILPQMQTIKLGETIQLQ